MPPAPNRWCARSASSAPAHMLSSVCDPGLEELAEAAPNALRLYQLYVRGDAAWVDDHVERAIAHGYSAFCLTVDTAHYSRRERDIAKRFVTAGRRRVQGRAFQAGLDWRTVERIKSKFKIPLALKGIATAEDARIAVEHGVDWIYVSNHGGRQLDHGRGSMDVLPEVVDAVAGRAKVMVDGSICRGSDIVKAIAVGRRPGRHGPHAVLCARRRRRRPAWCGCSSCWRTRCSAVSACSASPSFAELDRSYLHPAAPANAAACAERVPAAQDRRLSLLTFQGLGARQPGHNRRRLLGLLRGRRLRRGELAAPLVELDHLPCGLPGEPIESG